MTKSLNYSFTLNLSSPKKEHKTKNKIKLSRRCLCSVIKDSDNILKAKIIDSNNISEFLVIPFTDNSFNVNKKIYVFTKKLDKNGKHILIIRNSFVANLIEGDSRRKDANYTPIIENIVLSGHIINDNDKMYFDYEDFISFRENLPFINSCKIDKDTPLFR